ncbi:MAG: DUF3048 domain-containing protein [Actinobacteria bacterium]|nr:DUF3048 domain-containing protein [Actinomycetota bacterium]
MKTYLFYLKEILQNFYSINFKGIRMKKTAASILIGMLAVILIFSSAMVIIPGGIKGAVKEMAGLGSGRPVAIMVENSFAARPQSGLYLADVVFEVVDEYGITRFVAIYCTKDASIVGPFRSSRPYYAEIAKSFDPIHCFFGTYPHCYQYIESLGMYVMSAMTDRSGMSSIVGLCPYWRDWNRSKVQEHTAFTSTISIKQKAQQIGYPLEGNGIPFSYKGDAAEGDRGSINNVFIDFGTPAYSPKGFNVNFQYDRNSNSYLRYMGGKAHVDHETGQIISAKNVVVLITDIVGPIDQYKHMSVRTTGSGQAFYFLDGNAVEGTWERGGASDPFTFKDGGGRILSLNVGSTWVSMVMPGKVGWQ